MIFPCHNVGKSDEPVLLCLLSCSVVALNKGDFLYSVSDPHPFYADPDPT
jgi:hypothetical protein